MKIERRKSVRTRLLSKERRRGIVLLVVISLLALFILMGITFALVSSQYQYASKLEKEIERTGDLPEVEMDQILGQILYDTAARTSLQYHSLLRDLYGYDHDLVLSKAPGPEPRDTVRGSVTQVPTNVQANQNGNGQLFTFTFRVPVAPNPPVTTPYTILSPIPNYYAGRVITFADGLTANHSSRIVAYTPGAPDVANGPVMSGTLTMESIESKLAGPVSPVVGNTFVINGAPFNGSGAGYHKDNYNLTAQYYRPNPNNPLAGAAGVPIARMPHYGSYSSFNQGPGMPTYSADSALDYGGMDESYDAPDLQNLFLAMVPPRAAEQFARGAARRPIIPSFHRPELVTYSLANSPSDITASGSVLPLAYLNNTNNDHQIYQPHRDYFRGFTFRPMPWDHPNFSGSNANFAPTWQTYNGTGGGQILANVQQLVQNLTGKDTTGAIQYYWDVDNDNDGLPDSVWIDPGLPVVTTKDGRRYKRLAAILIKDLDGSVNVNAAGNLAQTTAKQFLDSQSRNVYVATTPLPSSGAFVTGNSTALGTALGIAPYDAQLPRGIGVGPAEIFFQNLLGTQAAYSAVLKGRYGNDGEPGAAGRDPLSVVKHYGIHNDYSTALQNNLPAWFFSPSDVSGTGTIVLDVAGQPIWAYAGRTGDAIDMPYELALSGESNNTDSPYTAAEMERLLRFHDSDAAQLPSRLLQLAGNISGGQLSLTNPGVIDTSATPGSDTRRNALTTHSSDIPAPALTIPQEVRQAFITNTNVMNALGQKMPGNATILDLYAAHLIAGGLTGNRVPEEMHKIVPWEFFKGQKFDINRWLGDGINVLDNTGVRDRPREAPGERAWPVNIDGFLPQSFRAVGPLGVVGQHTNTVKFDMNMPNNTTYMSDNVYARQLYARHLYCLALLMIPDAAFSPNCPWEATLSPNDYKLLMKRRIAQWAINCVEYRDQDSIMTPFEFDYNPWNGWQVDGNLHTDGTAAAPERYIENGTVQTQAVAERGLVWGMEQPDLIISETLAIHDRRLKDTAHGSGNPADNENRLRTDTTNPDATLDQLRVPQGSLFVELYCPRPQLRNAPVAGQGQYPLVARELYFQNGNLEIAKRAPAGATGQWPVWRMGLSKIERGNATQLDLHPANLVGTRPESASFEGIKSEMIPGGPTDRFRIDRYVYLGDISTLPPAEQDRAFYNTAANIGLQPGQYAVVGPRPLTYLGSQDPTSGSNTNPPPMNPTTIWGGNSEQYIQLLPTNVVVHDTTGNQTSRTVGTDMRPPLSIICGRPTGIQPTNWTNGPIPWRVGMNVTEPMATNAANYYPEANHFPNEYTAMSAGPNARATERDFYDDPDNPGADPTLGTIKGIPVEGSQSTVAGASWPIFNDSMQHTMTYLDYSSVYLERLADPTAPYNPPPLDESGNIDPNHDSGNPINPYIAVDWMSIDVTVFNGEERRLGAGGIVMDGDDDPANDNGTNELNFRSRQRGYLGTTNAPTGNPWSPVTYNGNNPWNPTLMTTQDPTYFSLNLSNTKGTTIDFTNDRHTLGSLNCTVDYPMTTAPYQGEPSAATPQILPFPWMSWNNRPFSNPMELLCVPASSPSRATLEVTPGHFSQFLSQTPAGTGSPYAETNTALSGMRSPFANLLNFFHVDSSGPEQQAQMHLCRLLDFVEVPSPYAGTERWYNPQAFGMPAPANSAQPMNGVTPPPANSNPIYYRPPFNKLSRFRDPGRININTIFDEDVWAAAVGQFPNLNSAAFFNILANSRKGSANGNWFDPDPALPTRFSNPFRTADSSDLSITGTNEPVQSTLLRRSLANPQVPLLQPTWNQPTTDNHHNSDRNPYFRYQALQKMGGIFTTRSNCFAVWITVGYFEVEDSPFTPKIDAAHPDGLVLGQEVGADSGEVVRHRSFFIIDRSIPVGFMPGSRLNTDDCVLVRRLIE